VVDAYTKPLPDTDDPVSVPFWEGTKAQKLIMPRCRRCSSSFWPPRINCPECLSFELDWVEVRPTGTLYSYTTYHRAFDPRFKEDIPYSVGFIELDDGVRMIGTMVGQPDDLVVDGPVRAVFDAVTPEVTLVKWEMA
jgi:uncharacterized OB-fold protein